MATCNAAGTSVQEVEQNLMGKGNKRREEGKGKEEGRKKKRQTKREMRISRTSEKKTD